MSEEIKLLEDGKVLVQYVDADLDIKNKKSKVVGKRDIQYIATYDNANIAANLMREKVNEYKNSVKEIQKGIEQEKENIAKSKEIIEINTITLTKVREMVAKSEDFVNRIKELK